MLDISDYSGELLRFGEYLGCKHINDSNLTSSAPEQRNSLQWGERQICDDFAKVIGSRMNAEELDFSFSCHPSACLEQRKLLARTIGIFRRFGNLAARGGFLLARLRRANHSGRMWLFRLLSYDAPLSIVPRGVNSWALIRELMTLLLTTLRHPLFLALLIAILGGWALSGVLLFLLMFVGAPGVAPADLPALANSLPVWCWFDAAMRAWAVVAAAWWLARQGLSFPWSRATLLGWSAGWALLFEVTFFPHGATATITPLLVWATVPLAWLGVLLACPLQEHEQVSFVATPALDHDREDRESETDLGA